MWVLGINAYHGDASAALFKDGELVAAAEEERFNRMKHAAGFPSAAIRYCLSAGGIGAEALDHVAVAKDPRAHLLQKMVYALKVPRLVLERAGPLRKFATIQEELASSLGVSPQCLPAQLHSVEHHRAHLASAFYVSGFEESALLSADGMGDFVSTMWGVGRGETMTVRGAVAFPHSLGLAYTALTQYLGFLDYGDEYKVMALASYAQPAYREAFQKIIRLKEPEGFTLGLEYFLHHQVGAPMTWESGTPKLGRLYAPTLTRLLGPPRDPGAPIETRHQEIASSLQNRLEEALLFLISRLHKTTGLQNLCLAGGVAFNCVANSKILTRTPFQRLFIQPAAGDAGLAIGAACYVWHHVLHQPRRFIMDHAYWGPQYSNPQLAEALRARSGELSQQDCRVTPIDGEDRLCQQTAQWLIQGKIAGWFQGRMEWGPRALGNRSILTDPRDVRMKEVLNGRIKRREPFRPFAPSVLAEKAQDYFLDGLDSPFMLFTAQVRPEKRARIPAALHIDGTGRLQTVTCEANGRYWKLLKAFEALSGVPVLLNTSFNEQEPIVCTPAEAIDCFLRTRMDVLVLGSLVVEKKPEEGR